MDDDPILRLVATLEDRAAPPAAREDAALRLRALVDTAPSARPEVAAALRTYEADRALDGLEAWIRQHR